MERTENISFEGKRILLVEDHPLNVIVAKGLLEKKQFEVVTAENGKKAVELVTDAPEYYFIKKCQNKIKVVGNNIIVKLKLKFYWYLII